jgi:type IV pilus assembly protein PilA
MISQGDSMKKQQKGFSLIELLIVVAIILIIAAIAIPNLLRSKMAANEASAVGSLRSINTAEVTYSSTYPTTGFGTLVQLSYGGACATASAANACLIDDTLAAGTKSGFKFAASNLTGTPVSTYSVNADAITPGSSGARAFFTNQTGVIHVSPTAGGATPATATDPALQ